MKNISRAILVILFLTVLNAFEGLAQNSLPKDYHNKTIQSKQRYTSAYFWTYLELNMPDSALNYVDSRYLAHDTSLKAKVFSAAKTISSIYKSCLPRGNGMITYTDTTNVVNVHYTIPSTPKLKMSLSFKQGDEYSKIVFIVFRNEKELAKDIKRSNRKFSDKPPKTPPPILE